MSIKQRKPKITKCIGFGFNPMESEHHILLENTKFGVTLYERWHYDIEDLDTTVITNNITTASQHSQPQAIHGCDIKLITIDEWLWNLIKDEVKLNFNLTLKENNMSLGKSINQNQIPFNLLLGKELTMLCWGIEDLKQDNKENKEVTYKLELALRNWKGLSREEKWYLYTMTRANINNMNSRKGWRKAIKCILLEE